MRRQYSYLLIANGLAAAATIIINALIPRIYSITDLSDFILVKRVITTVLSIQLVGLNISVAYFYPRVKVGQVFLDAIKLFLLVTVPSIIVIGVSISLAGFLDNESISIISYLLFSFTLSYNTLTFSIIRSQQNFKRAAIQHVKNMFLYPVICLLITDTLAHYFLVLFIVSVLDNSLTIRGILVSPIMEPKGEENIEDYSFAGLAIYGIQRFPMFITQIFIAALPLLYLKSINEVERIVIWGAALTMLRLVIMLAGPVNTIVLPRYSELLAQRDSNVKREVWKLNVFALGAGPFLMATLLLLMNPLIELWIGIDTAPYQMDTMLLSFVLPFMLASELVRSTVDALQTHSLNSYIYIFSITAAATFVAFVIAFSGFNVYHILVYLILVYAFIYVLSIYNLHRKISFDGTQMRYLISGVVLNAVLILSVYAKI